MRNLAVLGTQWGDEGKGKIVDLLCEDYDVVARYQGGHNAGHTVKFGDAHFALRLIPSGILHPAKLCILGNGMVIDPEALLEEIESLRGLGVVPKHIHRVIGVAKAYTSRVGGGAFPTELDAHGEHLRPRGNEFGTVTRRPRRRSAGVVRTSVDPGHPFLHNAQSCGKVSDVQPFSRLRQAGDPCCVCPAVTRMARTPSAQRTPRRTTVRPSGASQATAIVGKT
jgi:adenylosuccinate synthase